MKHLNKHEQQVVTFYEVESNSYDEKRWSSSAGKRLNHFQQQLVLDSVGPCRDKQIIDIGTGTGRFAIQLASQGASVIGVASDSKPNTPTAEPALAVTACAVSGFIGSGRGGSLPNLAVDAARRRIWPAFGGTPIRSGGTTPPRRSRNATIVWPRRKNGSRADPTHGKRAATSRRNGSRVH